MQTHQNPFSKWLMQTCVWIWVSVSHTWMLAYINVCPFVVFTVMCVICPVNQNGAEVNMTSGTRRTASELQWAHSGHYPFAPSVELLCSLEAPGPASTLTLSLTAPAQVDVVRQGSPRVQGSQLCKCFQLLCDWSWVLLFDHTPRQAQPWLFLAAAGDERMSAWL